MRLLGVSPTQCRDPCPEWRRFRDRRTWVADPYELDRSLHRKAPARGASERRSSTIWPPVDRTRISTGPLELRDLTLERVAGTDEAPTVAERWSWDTPGWRGSRRRSSRRRSAATIRSCSLGWRQVPTNSSLGRLATGRRHDGKTRQEREHQEQRPCEKPSSSRSPLHLTHRG